jgi:hypothetical protein
MAIGWMACSILAILATSVSDCGTYGSACFGSTDQMACTVCSSGYYLQATSNTCSINNPIGPSPTPQQQDFYDTSGQATATVTFAGITSGGATTVVPLAPGDAGFVPLPSTYSLGASPVYFDISTTATFTPPVTICVTYSNPPGTPHLLHYSAGSWTDVTTSINSGPPLSVCGQVTSFSNFGVGYDLAGGARYVLSKNYMIDYGWDIYEHVCFAPIRAPLFTRKKATC